MLQNLLIRQRVWILVACCLLGLGALVTIAVNKAQGQFRDLKNEQYVKLVDSAIKSIDYFYQQYQQGKVSEIEAKAMAKDALNHMALDRRNYFYLVNSEHRLLLAHPFVENVYSDDTPADIEASIQRDRKTRADMAKDLGRPKPMIDALDILWDVHPDTLEGFIDYQFYAYQSNKTPLIGPLDDPTFPDGTEIKTAYAAPFKPWNWVVFTGVFRDDEAQYFKNWLLHMISVSAAIIGVLLLVGWFISRSIAAPLNATVEWMKDIAEGTGDLNKRLEVIGKNELSQFAQGFNVFVEKIAGIVRSVIHTNSEVVQHSDLLTEVMSRNVKRSDEQLAQTEMLASATNELSYSLSSVAERAQNTSKAAHSAQEATNQSLQAMEKNIASINHLSEALLNTQSEVENMEAFSNKVSSVLEVIVGIAEQTNLLALNAAIEAARAGEQGRGFAVVADEVRTLAQRTQNSTSEIRDMINNLQSGTQRVVNAMTQGIENSEVCVQTATESNQVLRDVVEYVEQILQMNIDIASAVEQQSKTTHEIADSSSKIAENSRDNLADSETNDQHNREMSAQLQQMDALVRRFKV